MNSFDMRRLRYFLVIAELGSVTRAASELHIAQPALSHQIHQLEGEVGGKLFERSPQGVRLTELGARLAHESRNVLEAIRGMRDRLQQASHEPEGDIVIGVAQTIGPVLALPLLELAGQTIPRVRIRLRELMSSDIPDLLRSESIDFAFSYAISGGRGIRSTNIFSEDLFLVGTAAAAKKYFKRSDAKEINFADLREVPLYLSARLNGFREELERISRTKKIKLAVAAEVDSVAVRKEIALQGTGFTVLSGATIRREISQRSIFAARIVQPTIRRKICFVRRVGSPMSQAASAAVALIPECLKLIAQRDMWPGAMLAGVDIPKLV